jgi:diaminobutyrate-2-oxoglutarate transaminase
MVTPFVEPDRPEIPPVPAPAPAARPTDCDSPFPRLESEVRSYSRSFPVTFHRASGPFLFAADGTPYIDFLAGAGTLNYGHNHPALRDRLVRYVLDDGVAHGLDLHTVAMEEFLCEFERCILRPRGLDHVVQLPGPAGTNAVEAALKLARKCTGRQTVVAFTNGYHGVSAGALAVTGNRNQRAAAGVALPQVFRLPYDGYLGPDVNTAALFEKLLGDASSGLDLPAAVIVETVQGEGGLNVATEGWLRQLEALCRREGILLIVDDIQAGCGRTGTFLSFEPAGIRPDIVTLSKSLSGFGLPLSLTVFRRDLDRWRPGEHNGTFRGNNHAFVTAAEALRRFWKGDAFSRKLHQSSAVLQAGLQGIANGCGRDLRVKGRGMMQGLACPSGEIGRAVSQAAFRRGLIVETSGPAGEVVKCLPPLNIPDTVLEDGLDRLAQAFGEILS